MTKSDQELHQSKAQRALQLTDQGLETSAICERLGITRQRLHQIRHDAKQPRRKAAQEAGVE